MMAAAAQGLPMVLIPIAADQPDNAGLIASRGAGRVIAPDDRTVGSIRAAIQTVLKDESYRQNAVEVRREMAQLPGPDYAVSLLEQLAHDKVPIPSPA
jgi:UDP:flavonoid glycosyltransferase YjiC (YdhE family)